MARERRDGGRVTVRSAGRATGASSSASPALGCGLGATLEPAGAAGSADDQKMRDHHGVVGDTATYAFSVMAENAIPGGEAYRDYNPITIDIEAETPNVGVYPLGPFGPGVEVWDTPDIHIHEELPLPAGNLANFDDRWDWIENDMLPAYREFLAQPGGAETMVRMPVDERAADFRKFPDFPYPGS